MTEHHPSSYDTVYDQEDLFRLKHLQVPHRATPYEFVERRPAVTIMATTVIKERTHILQCVMSRALYGEATSLPGGNSSGTFDAPEPPLRTALRELKEETGYGYAAEALKPAHISLFALRDLSSTILYNRYFALLRNVTSIAEPIPNSHEVVEPVPVPATEYLQGLYRLERGETYPEINAAFGRAALLTNRRAVKSWVTGEHDSLDSAVPAAFAPWMTAIEFDITDAADIS